jgi:hypothetical protein
MTIEAVIINCSTKEQTTLALVSALQHGRLPVTVIDCQSTERQQRVFRAASAPASHSGWSKCRCADMALR